MANTRFVKTTKGRNQQVIVGTPIALSTDATIALFLANAPTGEIGVYDGNGARHTDAINPNEIVTFLQKKSDGSVKKTTPVKFSDLTPTRKTYVAPVKAVGSLGWSGTAGAINLAAAVAAGKSYELAIIELTDGFDPFPTWNFEYQAIGTDTEIDVMQALAKKINDFTALHYKSNQPLVGAKVKADATYSNYALGAGGTLTVTNGSTSIVTAVGTANFVVGDYISFDAAAAPTDAIGDIYKIVGNPDANTWTLNRAYQGATQTFIEAEAEGTRVKKVATFVATGLVFTSLYDNTTFNIIARQELKYATIVNLSAYTRGVGTPEQVMDLELEGNAMDGNTAGNTVYGNEAYGNPDKFANSNGLTETYDYFNLNANPIATLVSPPTQGRWFQQITIAAPKSAGGMTLALNTLLGLS